MAWGGVPKMSEGRAQTPAMLRQIGTAASTRLSTKNGEEMMAPTQGEEVARMLVRLREGQWLMPNQPCRRPYVELRARIQTQNGRAGVWITA